MISSDQSSISNTTDPQSRNVSGPASTNRPRPARNYTGWLILLNTLLFLLLVLSAVQFIFTYQQNQIAAQRAASYADRVAAAEKLVTSQQTVILGLLDNYHKDAYENSSIDRITEQQLIASEYNLAALQIVAIQNSQIIELLANAP